VVIGVVGWLRHRWLRWRLRRAARQERKALTSLKPIGSMTQTMHDITLGKHDDRHK